tara:strand:- start:323 stop:1321 length:999 start_codon:yes stop_codon:yes gene_type:complete
MSSPIHDENNLFPNLNLKQLTNRKNKFTIKYNNTDEIEEAIYLKKQRRYLKNRSEFFSNQSLSEPKTGEIIKIYNIEYFVEAFNPLNGKHTLVNTRNFQRRYFDLQLYSWNYVKPLFTNKFTLPDVIKPTIRSNLLLKSPLPAIPKLSDKKPIFDLKNSSVVLNLKENYVPIPNQFPNLSIKLPVSPVKSPLKMNRLSTNFSFDIEAQKFIPEPLKLLDFTSLNEEIESKPIVETDIIIEDLDLKVTDDESSDDDISNDKEHKEDITIKSCVNYDYFTGENIKNWDLPKKTSPLIIVHDNTTRLDSIVEDLDEDNDSKNEETKDEAGYCTIM